MAKKEEIPAVIKDISTKEVMEIALVENLQRENLTAIEEATAYRDIIDALQITQDDLAKKLGKSRSHITNMLGLLKLPLEVQDLVLKQEISMGHARVLSKLENKEDIRDLSDKIIKENLTVRELENKVNSAYKRNVEIKKRPKNNKTEYKYIEEALEEKLGTKVKILENKIQISYASDVDLNRILDILNISIED